MADGKIVVKGRGWFNRLKEVDEEPMQKISQVIMTGDELEINILNDLTNKICFYDHGPALSLYEIDSFCSQLCKSVKELKGDEKEIFSHMLCVIASRKGEENYVLNDTCMMILKPPYLVLLKFGNPTSVRYLLHLHNHVLYSLGTEQKNQRPTPYNEKAYEAYRQVFEGLKQDMIDAEQQRIIRDFSGFKEALKKEQYGYAQEICKTTENTKKFSQALAVLAEKINEAQESLLVHEKEAMDQFAIVHSKMISGQGLGRGKADDGGLDLPELREKK